VFPWQFYIDSKGFAGGASRYPFDFDRGREIPPGSFYAQMQARAVTGESKFEQPPISEITIKSDAPYVLFLCQIPHDETIKYHSDVRVWDALKYTLEATKELNMPLVVKGHPVNPGSMAPLHSLCMLYKHVYWFDKINIHDLIPKAHAVVVVNSGTGMETLLHKRPIVTFGRCEYDCVSNKATADNIVDILRSPVFNEKEVRAFFESWYEWTYDTRSGKSFENL
jgi:capsule polysaccharide modification protein KpsS